MTETYGITSSRVIGWIIKKYSDFLPIESIFC